MALGSKQKRDGIFAVLEIYRFGDSPAGRLYEESLTPPWWHQRGFFLLRQVGDERLGGQDHGGDGGGFGERG